MVKVLVELGTGGDDGYGSKTMHSFNNSDRGPLGAMFPAREPERSKNGPAQEGNLWPSGGDRHVNRELQKSPVTALMVV